MNHLYTFLALDLANDRAREAAEARRANTLTSGTARSVAPGFDIDALVEYLGSGPVAPGPANRITRTS